MKKNILKTFRKIISLKEFSSRVEAIGNSFIPGKYRISDIMEKHLKKSFGLHY